jgi:hypothetical protein
VKQHVEGSAEDLDFQALIGRTVTKKVDDPLCSTAAQCLQVASHELMVVKRQRSRVKFTKITHLQDEEGDTIKVPHPYTAFATKIFITDLTRKFKMPSTPTGEGYFFDEIEGWRI